MKKRITSERSSSERRKSLLLNSIRATHINQHTAEYYYIFVAFILLHLFFEVEDEKILEDSCLLTFCLFCVNFQFFSLSFTNIFIWDSYFSTNKCMHVFVHYKNNHTREQRKKII